MKQLIYLIFFVSSFNLNAQLLELDYRSPVKRESLFKIVLFKQFMAGVNTLGQLDISTEVLNTNYSASNGFLTGLSVVATSSIISGNKDDKKNNLSHLLNPMGGINGSIYLLFPLLSKEKSSLKLSSRMGIKLIQGTPLQGFENRFLSNYGLVGFLYQRLLFEDAPENERIDFWIHPHMMVNQTKEQDLKRFFNNELEPISYGYGLQTGVVFNQKLRVVLLVNQFLNTLAPESVGIPVLRFSLIYRR